MGLGLDLGQPIQYRVVTPNRKWARLVDSWALRCWTRFIRSRGYGPGHGKTVQWLEVLEDKIQWLGVLEGTVHRLGVPEGGSQILKVLEGKIQVLRGPEGVLQVPGALGGKIPGRGAPRG
jgi:hypothetical protein